jgi:tripartite-type tricarboxylate transporter receptor subunit TctC
MTGAGGTTAVLHLYNRAARDGTVIGMPHRNFAIAPLANDQLRYDGRQLTAIGSTTNEVQIGVVWHEVGVSGIDDLKAREISVGITSFYDAIGSQALIAKALTGARLKMVTGYPGGNDISVAMERREVDGQFGMSLGVLKTRLQNWLEQKKINIILQSGLEKSPELPNVPFIMDYARSDVDRKALELLLASNAFAWPFVAPPGVPADRIAILRRAFDATMKDPGFLADARQSRLEVNPLGGEAMQAMIERILGYDATVVARSNALVAAPR